MVCRWLRFCPLRELGRKGKISDKWREKYCESKNKWKECKRYGLEKEGKIHKNILPDGTRIDNNGKD